LGHHRHQGLLMKTGKKRGVRPVRRGLCSIKRPKGGTVRRRRQNLGRPSLRGMGITRVSVSKQVPRRERTVQHDRRASEAPEGRNRQKGSEKKKGRRFVEKGEGGEKAVHNRGAAGEKGEIRRAKRSVSTPACPLAGRS